MLQLKRGPFKLGSPLAQGKRCPPAEKPPRQLPALAGTRDLCGFQGMFVSVDRNPIEMSIEPGEFPAVQSRN
jgi:hypothetical protein